MSGKTQEGSPGVPSPLSALRAETWVGEAAGVHPGKSVGGRGKLPQGCCKGPPLSPDPDLPLCRLPGSPQEARAELEQRAARGWSGQGCTARQSASHGELGAWSDPARSPRLLGGRPGPPGTPASRAWEAAPRFLTNMSAPHRTPSLIFILTRAKISPFYFCMVITQT